LPQRKPHYVSRAQAGFFGESIELHSVLCGSRMLKCAPFMRYKVVQNAQHRHALRIAAAKRPGALVGERSQGLSKQPHWRHAAPLPAAMVC
jgi:hypothetical protein